MNEQEIKDLAEAHWKYTEQIILQQTELIHYLYVQALIYGIKHGMGIKNDK